MTIEERKEELGFALLRARRRARRTLAEIYCETGIAISTISDIETGKRYPQRGTLETLAGIFPDLKAYLDLKKSLEN